MADNAARIAEIRTILRSGVTSVETDGTKIQYDHASLRAELRSLQAEDDAQRSRRPVASTINLGSC